MCAVIVSLLVGGLSVGTAAAEAATRITDHLYGTHFVDRDHGWAVGAFGSIFQTTDGAHTWVAQKSGTLEQLFGVSFADKQNGWAVGRTGLVLHTTDAGKTWERQNTGNDKHLFDVSAIDAQRAVAVGDWGVILATEDGGKTWQDRTLERDVILAGQAWPSPELGWVVGELGAILHSSDGGKTWQEQQSGVEKTLFGVHFVDTQRGWASGLDGIILRTEDGGQNWQLLRGKAEVNELEQVGVAEAFENASLYDISLAGDIGYAVGDVGGVFLSIDGGNTWKRKEVPGEWKLGWIRGLSLAPDGSGLFVGANGLAIRVEGTQIKVPEKN